MNHSMNCMLCNLLFFFGNFVLYSLIRNVICGGIGAKKRNKGQ